MSNTKKSNVPWWKRSRQRTPFRKEDLKSLIKQALKEKDYITTYMLHIPGYFHLQDEWWQCTDRKWEDEELRWAIVLGWVDVDDYNGKQLYAKLAHQSNHSGMSEYDFDWNYPIVDAKTGECDINEIPVEYFSDINEVCDYFSKIIDSYRTDKITKEST